MDNTSFMSNAEFLNSIDPLTLKDERSLALYNRLYAATYKPNQTLLSAREESQRASEALYRVKVPK